MTQHIFFCSTTVVSFICTSSSSPSTIREATGCCDIHSNLCIKENSLSLGLVHQTNEKQQEWKKEQFWLCTTSALPWALLSFSRKMQMWTLIISISSLALTPFSEICCRHGPRRMGAQLFWSSAGPLNRRHDLDIQKTGLKYPRAKHMPVTACWCYLTMIGFELSLRDAWCW